MVFKTKLCQKCCVVYEVGTKVTQSSWNAISWQKVELQLIRQRLRPGSYMLHNDELSSMDSTVAVAVVATKG